MVVGKDSLDETREPHSQWGFVTGLDSVGKLVLEGEMFSSFILIALVDAAVERRFPRAGSPAVLTLKDARDSWSEWELML